jgi:hypothetical protein
MKEWLSLSPPPLLGSIAQLRPWPPPQNPAEFLGGFSTIFYGVGLLAPRPTPILEDPPEAGWPSYSPRALGTHFSRLLRHACVTVGLFLFPGHHTGMSLTTATLLFNRMLFGNATVLPQNNSFTNWNGYMNRKYPFQTSR